jgi:hypothetical protein
MGFSGSASGGAAAAQVAFEIPATPSPVLGHGGASSAVPAAAAGGSAAPAAFEVSAAERAGPRRPTRRQRSFKSGEQQQQPPAAAAAAGGPLGEGQETPAGPGGGPGSSIPPATAAVPVPVPGQWMQRAPSPVVQIPGASTHQPPLDDDDDGELDVVSVGLASGRSALQSGLMGSPRAGAGGAFTPQRAARAAHTLGDIVSAASAAGSAAPSARSSLAAAVAAAADDPAHGERGVSFHGVAGGSPERPSLAAAVAPEVAALGSAPTFVKSRSFNHGDGVSVSVLCCVRCYNRVLFFHARNQRTDNITHA